MMYRGIQCYSPNENIFLNSEDVIVLTNRVFLILKVLCASGPYFECLVLTNENKIIKTSFNILYLI